MTSSTPTPRDPLDELASKLWNLAHQADIEIYYIEAKAALTRLMLDVIGEDEVDKTGINTLTQYGLRIENRNQLRAEQRTRLQSLTPQSDTKGGSDE